MSERKLLPGKFTWFELVTPETKKAQAFYGEVFGWKTTAFPMGASTYTMILTGDSPDTMIGGYASPAAANVPSHWLAYVSVEDVDAAARTAAANGAKVTEAPNDIPGVGRRARISDPQGAALCLITNARGDAPDVQMTPYGGFLWNELHTPDPEKALAFYEKVIGFTHKSMPMGAAGMYHIVSRGGVDRGGVTGHLPAGVAPHWLPYVHVEDVDATIARAKRLGAALPMAPEDIPGVGRVGAIADPMGAVIAMLKPLPRDKM